MGKSYQRGEYFFNEDQFKQLREIARKTRLILEPVNSNVSGKIVAYRGVFTPEPDEEVFVDTKGRCEEKLRGFVPYRLGEAVRAGI